MLVLVSGGSGSGKSLFAETLAQNLAKSRKEQKLFYIATMIPSDAENRVRIRRHQNMRSGKGFETIECFLGLKELSLPSGCVVLLECMSNLTANEMFSRENIGANPPAVHAEGKLYPSERTFIAVKEGILHLLDCAAHIILVTNEIFSDAVCFERETVNYLQTLGRLNEFAASAADAVVEVVYGIPVWHKENLPQDKEIAE